MVPTTDNSPLVVDVRRNSLDDGPGIRSVVFFKGCPLRCVWCQNPEAISARAELQPSPEQCLKCGNCVQACPEGLPAGLAAPMAATCSVCGACVELCPAGARRVAGQAWALDELVELLAADAPFYKRSGGGVTLSGGEPLMFPEWVGPLAEALAAKGIHVLVETAGHFDLDRVSEFVLPHLGTVYFDLKLFDSDAHKLHAGRSNERILENFRRLVALGFDGLLARVPLVPGITTDASNLEALAGFLSGLGVGRVALLAYNPLWIAKRKALGMELPYDHSEWMSDEDVQACGRVFEEVGIEVLA